MVENFEAIIESYRTNPVSVYNTWFINSNERLKAFRSIRRGVEQVVDDIRHGTFPNDFRGSSLEVILSCITEQKEVFEGAAHPFYWKPKLRIPDIYENEENKGYFGQFLEQCLTSTTDEAITGAILRLAQKNIKGLGPAVTNIVYFLHPTVLPPFNTAIVKGYNQIFGENRKLGSWNEYLAIKEAVQVLNERYRQSFSNDLGAIGGLLYEVGSNRLLVNDAQIEDAAARIEVEERLAKRRKSLQAEQEEEDLHTEMQFHLLKIGAALGYSVIPAANDRARSFEGHSFSFMAHTEPPSITADKETANTIRLIDVLWFTKDEGKIVSAFEVEKSTSIYSGILRLSDLSFSMPQDERSLFIVIPDSREKDVVLQLKRPSIRSNGVSIRYILFSDLREHCEALCKFGEDHQIMRKISKSVE
jgi:type II restriction enzyme